ncbi:LMBR1 domain-containing protein [Verticillium alfalfae VaMs.102]|uniref:LMBR1 domain-containing protein n=1 Tax=Verticillium alfalfae (strain VaMs.102 / ATCC MYA-4576 / FGSC 10136) TaxID=526221 RepID=C9SV87_VERA1|nr:LMBR1 domain-containing protein [Verticillium alfalfae VaMs.102]EEY22702.1 LMBR1 domain-containing protein [Verticillium alfalfae VaMs.102]
MFHIVSASSVAPSVVLTLLALLTISLVVLLILRFYLPLRTTPAFYLVPIFFALWLPACMVLLVPVDLASGAKTDDEATRGVWLPARVLLVSWRITYWLTFALTWFVNPLANDCSAVADMMRTAGLSSPSSANTPTPATATQRQCSLFSACKCAESRHGLRAGLVGLVYLVTSHGLNFASLKTTIMALAYFWGLIFAIYLMGHGLVSIPRRLFRFASISGRLRRLQNHAPKVHERMEDSLLTLEDIEVQISELSRRKVGSARDFQEWIDELVEMANLPESQPRAGMRGSAESRVLPTVITAKYMADLTRKLTRARHARSRYTGEWNHLVQEAAATQAILDSAASKKLDFGEASPHAGFWDRTTILTPYSRYIFYYHIQPYGSILIGLFLAACSACIVWSELIKAAFPKLSVIRISVVHHWVGDKGQVGFAGQVISIMWLLYMCSAAFITMTEVKTWRSRALVKRNTGYESAFWYAGQVAKLSVPLSYNFMTFLPKVIYEKTLFYHILGQYINLTPLTSFMDYLFPILVLVPVLATLFGLYGKVQRFFGFGVDIIEDEDEDSQRTYGAGSWREGRDLIERDLGGNSSARRREETFARLGAAAAASAARSAPVLTVPGGASSPARSPVRHQEAQVDGWRR